MANNWFQFKQFRIEQGQSGMKVSTDACLFGAWLSELFQEKSGRILDVGTGTGLLSLMILQNNPNLMATAIEPEPGAFEDAFQNFNSSLWKNQFTLFPLRFQDFVTKPEVHLTYDLIFSNPPFFQNQLPSKNGKRNLARHDSLLPKELAKLSAQISHPKTLLAVMYPRTEWEHWLKVAFEFGWHLTKELSVRPSPERPIHRVCGFFERQINSPESVERETISILGNDNSYSPRFLELLQPFYL